MSSSDIWTTRELCQSLVLRSPIADEALVEFLRRYRRILRKVSASLPRRSWNEDYVKFEQWVLSWLYANRKIEYLAVDLMSKLDPALPDSIVAGIFGAYFRQMVIRTARNDYLKEEGLDGRTPTGEYYDEFDYLNRPSRTFNPSEEENDDPSIIDLESSFDDQKTDNPFESEEPDELRNGTEKEEDEHIPDMTGSPRIVPIENILGQSTIDSSRGSSSASLEGEELFPRFMEFYRELSPRDRVIFALKEYGVFERLIILDEDWEYLEGLTGSARTAIEKRIEDEYRSRPGATKKPVRTEFIASLLNMSKANVDQVFSRLKKKRAELLGHEAEDR